MITVGGREFEWRADGTPWIYDDDRTAIISREEAIELALWLIRSAPEREPGGPTPETASLVR